MIHGTLTTYTYYKCRCGECRAARASYEAMHRMDLAGRLDALPAESHGKYSTYVNYGCRCDKCRAAASAVSRAQYVKRKAVTS